MHQHFLRALVLLTALSATLVACGDDDKSDFTLAISTDRETLAGDNADPATITVMVPDHSLAPPAADPPLHPKPTPSGQTQSSVNGRARTHPT